MNDATPRSVSPAFAREVRRVCPDGVLDARADRVAYSYDAKATGGLPALVVLPRDEAEVQAILHLAAEHRVPVVPRGAATGTTGASVPGEGWLVLCLSRMNRILEVNARDLFLRVQPGATTARVQEAAEEVGLFYPPDPASAKTCTIGGNVATGAGGLRAVKYGVTRDYVLGLVAYRMGGERLRTGVLTRKGVVGYDLTRLLVGSEGTLAVVTEIALRLIARPAERRTILAEFDSVEAACSATHDVLTSGAAPDAIELLDEGTLAALARYGETALGQGAAAVLLIEIDGDADAVTRDVATVQCVLADSGAGRVRVAGDAREARALWDARRAVSPATYALAPFKVAEDVTVPVSRMPELVRGVRAIAARYDLLNVNYGHAGDGNLHVNLLAKSEAETARAREAAGEIFDLTLALSGTLSGEHGVGLSKRPYVARELDPASIRLSHAIKRAFDPDGLLNPGKMFPDLG